MNEIRIDKVESTSDAHDLDELLWEVLWKPLDLPRNIGNSFTLDGECLKLSARIDKTLVGGLVANWTSATDVEIRHLAVRSEHQNQGVGSCVIETLLHHLPKQRCRGVYAIARNTSAEFFRKLGFSTALGEPPENPFFKKHDITFKLMENRKGQDYS